MHIYDTSKNIEINNIDQIGLKSLMNLSKQY